MIVAIYLRNIVRGFSHKGMVVLFFFLNFLVTHELRKRKKIPHFVTILIHIIFMKKKKGKKMYLFKLVKYYGQTTKVGEYTQSYFTYSRPYLALF